MIDVDAIARLCYVGVIGCAFVLTALVMDVLAPRFHL